MAKINKINSQLIKIKSAKHHLKASYCKTRLRYRQGKKETSVKVYTINDESKYLLIQGVPNLNLENELFKLCSKYGPIEMLSQAQDYPSLEQFSSTFVVKFKFFKNSKYAKKHLDDLNFMGQVLHVCFLPELESVQETIEKLKERKKMVNSISKRFSKKLNKINKNDLISKTNAPKLCQQSLTYMWKKEKNTINKSNQNKFDSFQSTSYYDVRLKIKEKMEKLKKPISKINWG